MAGITSALCSSFKKEVFQGLHVFGTDVFKIALIIASPSGTFGAATTNYSNLGSDEVSASGTGYSTGGATLTPTVSLQGTVGVVDFAKVSWSVSSITSAGGLIYNSSRGGRAVAVVSFGGTQQAIGGTFEIQFPATGAATSMIRYA